MTKDTGSRPAPGRR